MAAAPRLAVDWEPRWAGFCAAVGPALGRSMARLHLEQLHSGPRPRAVLASALLHAGVLSLLLLALPQFRQSVAVVPRAMEDFQIAYVPRPYLPPLQDQRGAEKGRSGKSGGQTAPGPQPIRIANGSLPGDRLVRAPNLQLPKADGDVANMLSVKPQMPIAPAAGQVHRSARDLTLPEMANLEIQRPPDPVQLPRERPRLQDVPAPALAQRENMPGLPQARVMIPTEAPPVPIRSDLGRKSAEVSAPSLAVATPAAAAPKLPVAQAVMPVNAAPVQIRGDAPGNSVRSAARVTAPSLGKIGGTGHALPSLGGGSAPALPRLAEQGGGRGAPGSGAQTAAIISTHPGTSPGLPGDGGEGSFATSPHGTGSGMGGTGGGTGIGSGNGSGSGTSGTGPGAADRGTGLGRDAMAHGGTSPGAGPGGAGNGGSGGVAGVAIESAGVLNLPSFTGPSPSLPDSHPTVYGPRRAPAVTIVGTSRSGGALNAYGALRANKVYTVYLDTPAGTAVLEYAQHTAASRDFGADLTSPEPIRMPLPQPMPRVHVVLHGVLGTDGALHQLRALAALDPALQQRLLSALAGWRFRPVLRGDSPVDVEVLLGFNITVE